MLARAAPLIIQRYSFCILDKKDIITLPNTSDINIEEFVMSDDDSLEIVDSDNAIANL